MCSRARIHVHTNPRKDARAHALTALRILTHTHLRGGVRKLTLASTALPLADMEREKLLRWTLSMVTLTASLSCRVTSDSCKLQAYAHPQARIYAHPQARIYAQKSWRVSRITHAPVRDRFVKKGARRLET